MPPCRRHPCWPLLLVLLAAALALGGCLDEATNQDYAFNNSVDPNPDVGDDEGAGLVRIALVVPVAGERVVVHNGSTVDVVLTGWTLKGETTEDVYTFPTFTLGAGKFVRVHSRTDITTDTSTDLYGSGWVENGGSPGDHFSGTTDQAFLYDSSGGSISTCSSASTNTCWAND